MEPSSHADKAPIELDNLLHPLDSYKPTAGPRRKSRRRTWLVVAVITIVLALALGLGLGLGLHHYSSSTSSPDGSTPNSAGATSPGNSSDIVTTLTRQQLLGDQNRWLLSNRKFEISSQPQTRTFNWTISEVNAAPGAFVKPMLVVNGMSPGPVLEANLGDRVIINVVNNMTNETTIHWHGQYLQNENYMDGTYSITQCGIPPGGSMAYNWTVQQSGTSWWHAHKGTEYTDGLYGPIILHAPNETAMTSNKYDDDYTIMLNDMYNTQGSALLWRFQALGSGLDGNPGDEPSPDGGMINGVSQSTCAYIPASNSVQVERRRVRRSTDLEDRAYYGNVTVYPETNYCGNDTTEHWNVTWIEGNTYRIRLINAGTFVNTIFSIDFHPLTVIEADGTSVEPFIVDSVTLGVAQRYSVLVTLDQTKGAYWIRNVLATDQLRYTAPNFNETTLGVLRYQGVDSNLMPQDQPAPTLSGVGSFDQSNLVPADVMDAPPSTSQVFVQFGMQYSSNNQHYMYFNQSSWSPMAPGQSVIQTIQELGSGTSFSGNSTALQALSNGRLGDQLTIVNEQPGFMDLTINSLDDGDHPFHLHGHTFQIMSLGSGGFHDSSSGLNTTNPMRRDTVIIPSYGHAVLRIDTGNPGIWVFHCHISWHMEIGLLLAVVDLPDQIAAFDVPDDMRQLCKTDTILGY